MSIPSWAKPGVKVVCVSEYWPCLAVNLDLPNPVKGQIYTIDAVDCNNDMDSGIGVWLLELDDEALYDLDQFRPVISRTQSQDIALFKSILTDIREGERV